MDFCILKKKKIQLQTNKQTKTKQTNKQKQKANPNSTQPTNQTNKNHFCNLSHPPVPTPN